MRVNLGNAMMQKRAQRNKKAFSFLLRISQTSTAWSVLEYRSPIKFLILKKAGKQNLHRTLSQMSSFATAWVGFLKE